MVSAFVDGGAVLRVTLLCISAFQPTEGRGLLFKIPKIVSFTRMSGKRVTGEDYGIPIYA
jgi:hypothetical protein